MYFIIKNMISNEEIKKIRELLEKCQNPIFFFDNDLDGLASFLILARYIGRGKGVVIKSFPDVNANYLRKVEEFNPDFVFVLDKPLVSQGFLVGLKQKNIPLVWIDHHDISEIKDENIYYFNPRKGEKPSSEPVSYWCYKICNKKEDMWLGVAGSIADGYMPEFVEEFNKLYPELKISKKSALDAIYETELGRIIQILNFALKDRISNVVKMCKFLLKVKSPFEILEENSKTNLMHNRFRQVNKKYKKLLEKAIKNSSEQVLFFQYSGDLSISADLSNELFYRFPEKVIVVAYISGEKANISIRGKINVKKIIEEILKEIDGTGGGHENACGAKISTEDVPKFKDMMIKLVSKK